MARSCLPYRKSGHPRLADIERAIGRLPSLAPSFGGGLEDVLNAVLAAVTPSEQARLSREGIAIIDAYREQLAATSGLLRLEQFAATELRATTKLHSTLDEVLAAIVNAVLGLAQNLGIQTVAEGVEDVGQAEYLRSRGCDVAQGYLFSWPIEASLVPQVASLAFTGKAASCVRVSGPARAHRALSDSLSRPRPST